MNLTSLCCGKPLTAGICATLLALGCQGEAMKQNAIRQAVQSELTRYPHATLVDLYKFFHQGAFGPGHMIPDSAAARRFLQLELQNTTEYDTVAWQPVGYQGNFYRINLRLVQEGIIPFAELLAAFVASANSVTPPSREDWRREWAMILEVMATMQLDLPDFQQDSLMLARRLEAGELAVHHSAEFTRHHHPHYRVVDRHYFAQLRALAAQRETKP